MTHFRADRLRCYYAPHLTLSPPVLFRPLHRGDRSRYETNGGASSSPQAAALIWHSRTHRFSVPAHPYAASVIFTTVRGQDSSCAMRLLIVIVQSHQVDRGRPIAFLLRYFWRDNVVKCYAQLTALLRTRIHTISYTNF